MVTNTTLIDMDYSLLLKSSSTEMILIGKCKEGSSLSLNFSLLNGLKLYQMYVVIKTPESRQIYILVQFINCNTVSSL